ncbi:unnamed protein product [marine sediment metagenome]|uniref:Uncharacterized protein n=1 Tax=marine sediment metagenome TaxID=412755 RepID=X1SYJ5_9ZZZZ
MPIDEKIIDDIKEHTDNVQALQDWLDKLYFDTQLSTVFNRPILSILITGCRFMIANLAAMKTTYLTKRGG